MAEMNASTGADMGAGMDVGMPDEGMALYPDYPGYESQEPYPYLPVPIPAYDNFNPHTNQITYIFPDASNMTFTMGQIDEFRTDQVLTTSIFSAQIGAAFVVFLVMFCITHLDKRRTPVFILNTFNLAVVVVRGILYVHYFVSPLARTYTTFSWDTSDVPASEIHASLVSSVMSLLLMIGIQISLFLQVRICFSTQPRAKVLCLSVAGVISALSTAGYLTMGIYIIQLRDRPPNFSITNWAQPTVNALVALSIVTYSGLFCWKMAESVKNRRSLGFTGLGALETLLICGFQCLIFPAIFLIVENIVKFGGSASLAQALIAFVLPVSHLWATKVQGNSRISLNRMSSMRTTNSPGVHRQKNRLVVARDTLVSSSERFFKSLLSGLETALVSIPSFITRRRQERRNSESTEAFSKDTTVQLGRKESAAGESTDMSYSSKDSGFAHDLETGVRR